MEGNDDAKSRRRVNVSPPLGVNLFDCVGNGELRNLRPSGALYLMDIIRSYDQVYHNALQQHTQSLLALAWCFTDHDLPAH